MYEYRKHSLHCPTNTYQTQWHCRAISDMLSAEMYVYIPASHFICEWLCAIEHRDSEHPDHELLQKSSAKYQAQRLRNASSVEKNKKLLNWGHFKGAFLLFINRVLITHELFVSFCKHPFSRHSELASEVHGTLK